MHQVYGNDTCWLINLLGFFEGGLFQEKKGLITFLQATINTRKGFHNQFEAMLHPQRIWWSLYCKKPTWKHKRFGQFKEDNTP